MGYSWDACGTESWFRKAVVAWTVMGFSVSKGES